MSDDIAIRIEGLGKRYRYGGVKHVSDSFRAELVGWARRLVGRKSTDHRPQTTDHRPKPADGAGQIEGLKSEVCSLKSPTTSRDDEYFWALKDINLEIRRGEVVGIIGRNGAGKSTLLKILSRITAPTTGSITYNGRIASLLEVGTGFHRELTGRENIYLNGSILGMKRAEISKKFDEIVAFAEVEKFIDTPVKFYSSGMYVRLAFAVAAHLEPEILVVDEVLAVGDAQFQKKCLGKMGDVAKQGRTILFVSHNMTAVRSMCTSGVLLQNGVAAANGQVAPVVREYLEGAGSGASVREWPDIKSAPGNEHVRLLSVSARPPQGEPVITIDSGALLELSFYNTKANINLACSVFVVNNEGILLFEAAHIVSCMNDSEVGLYKLSATLPSHLLNAGRYYLSVLFGQDQSYVLFRMDEAVSFDVENTATGRGANMTIAPGIIRPLLQWQSAFSKEPFWND